MTWVCVKLSVVYIKLTLNAEIRSILSGVHSVTVSSNGKQKCVKIASCQVMSVRLYDQELLISQYKI